MQSNSQLNSTLTSDILNERSQTPFSEKLKQLLTELTETDP